jgi:hypothetical protein
MDQEPTLPFTVTMTETRIQPYPRYFAPSDFPPGFALIEGDLWVMGKNGDHPVVWRWKGSNIEDAVNQPAGTAGRPFVFGSALGEDPNELCHRPYI